MTTGRVHQVSLSKGGVPKLAVAHAYASRLGLEGDRQNDTKHHGGPDRAVCLFSLEVIRLLQAEGHPIAPGSTGENVTIEGIDWAAVRPGDRLEFEHGPILEITRHTTPCSKIRASFIDGDASRLRHDRYPGQSRLYARVLIPGELRPGQAVRHRPAPEPAQA